MTANFDSQNSDHQRSSDHQSQQALDVMQRDRFELLSAYMDGEVSPEERRQVEDWLAHDQTVQRLHARLLKLRQAFQTMPVPVSDEHAVQQTIEAVLAKVDRRPRLAVIWGGIAIAAVALGALTSSLLGGNPFADQMAQRPEVQTPAATEEPLVIALDKPLVSLPESGAPAPQQTIPASNSSNVR